jgi:inorganic pyrophosphatase
MIDPRTLHPWTPDGALLAVVETPKGTPNKLAFDHQLGGYRLKKVLPAGMVFPFDFGFVPGTRGQDGDPLDVLLLLDEPLWPGCLVEGVLLGVLEAEQQEDGVWIRNDRLIARASQTRAYERARRLTDLDPVLLAQIEAFFVDFNRIQGRPYRCLARRGPRRATGLVRDASR